MTFPRFSRLASLGVVLWWWGGANLPANEPTPGPSCAADLRRLSACALEELFAQGTAGEMPQGRLEGEAVQVMAPCLPKLKAKCFNVVWRGKHVGPEGCFVNRWVGDRHWLGVQAVIGMSWSDGRPAIVLDYPAGTPIFGGMHDEIRQIGPGLYLGKVYQTRPCPQLRAYFVLQTTCCP